MTSHWRNRADAGRLVGWSLVWLALLLLGASAQAQGPVQGPVRFCSRIQGLATTRVMPEYPGSSVDKKVEGVAVVEILTDVDGRVARADVLEAPDMAIAEAVRSAVLQWRIEAPQVFGSPERRRAQAKLTFYFRIRDGRGVVLEPYDMPGGPARPAPGVGRTPGGAPPPPPSTPPRVVIGGHGDSLPEIDTTEFERLLRNPETIVLDVRDRATYARGHHARAVNIPGDELGLRASIELTMARMA